MSRGVLFIGAQVTRQGPRVQVRTTSLPLWSVEWNEPRMTMQATKTEP